MHGGFNSSMKKKFQNQIKQGRIRMKNASPSILNSSEDGSYGGNNSSLERFQKFV